VRPATATCANADDPAQEAPMPRTPLQSRDRCRTSIVLVVAGVFWLALIPTAIPAIERLLTT
jgi:hypothetical protein